MSKQPKEEILKIANTWKKPAGLITEGEIGARNGQLIAEEIERGGLAWRGVWSYENLDAAVKRLGDRLAYNVKIVERVVEKIIEKPVEVERQPTAEEVAKKEREAKQKRNAFLAAMGNVPTDMDKTDWDNRHKRPEEFVNERLAAAKAAGANAANDRAQAEAQSTAATLIANWGNGLIHSKRQQGQGWLQSEWSKLLATTTAEKALPDLRQKINEAWSWAEGNTPTREDRMGGTAKHPIPR